MVRWEKTQNTCIVVPLCSCRGMLKKERTPAHRNECHTNIRIDYNRISDMIDTVVIMHIFIHKTKICQKGHFLIL